MIYIKSNSAPYLLLAYDVWERYYKFQMKTVFRCDTTTVRICALVVVLMNRSNNSGYKYSWNIHFCLERDIHIFSQTSIYYQKVVHTTQPNQLVTTPGYIWCCCLFSTPYIIHDIVECSPCSCASKDQISFISSSTF